MASTPSHLKMHSHYMGIAGPALRTAIGLTAGLCFIAYGYGQGDIGGLMVEPTFVKSFPTFDVSGHPENPFPYARRSGAIIASWNLGCLVGAITTVFFGDKLGRKGSTVLGLVIETIGKIIQATSFELGQYTAGRVIAGVGNGIIVSTVPAWQAECLKTHKRGTMLLVSFGTCITLGLAFAYWMVYGFNFTQPNSASWRVPIIFAELIILPALLIAIFMPESPRWLLLKGREKEAINVLSALNELPDDHEDIRREILQIKYAVKHMAAAPASAVFSNGEYRYLHRTLLAVLLQAMSQFTGINLFMQYLGPMFQNELLYPVRTGLLLAGGCATAFLVASMVAVYLIDQYWGRRSLTMFGASGMCLCMIMLSIFDYIGAEMQMEWGFTVMTVVLYLFVCFFSIGWQGMSWMWSVELIPLNIRGPANALATASNWLSNFIVLIATANMFAFLGYQTYIFYGTMNFVIVPTIYFLYPETGARSLEEVDIVFKSAYDRGNPWLSVVKAAREEPRWFDKNGDPTDSYGSSERDDLEKGSNTGSNSGSNSGGGHNSSPEGLWRTRTQSSPRLSSDAWGPIGRGRDEGAAPAPNIGRRSSSRDALSGY